jgi:hypothetical protein
VICDLEGWVVDQAFIRQLTPTLVHHLFLYKPFALPVHRSTKTRLRKKLTCLSTVTISQAGLAAHILTVLTDFSGPPLEHNQCTWILPEHSEQGFNTHHR